MESGRSMITAGLMQIINNNRSNSYNLGTTIKQGEYMQWLKNIYLSIRREIKYRRKLRQLRKRDPFIYK